MKRMILAILLIPFAIIGCTMEQSAKFAQEERADPQDTQYKIQKIEANTYPVMVDGVLCFVFEAPQRSGIDCDWNNTQGKNEKK